MKQRLFFNKIPCRNFQIWKNGPKQTLMILMNLAPVKLNKTAAFIWLHCNGRTKVSSIIAAMTKEYPSIPKRKLYMDTKEFIQSAEQTGLLLADWNTF